MLFTAFFWWWYGQGWRGQVIDSLKTLTTVADTFSIKLLLKTLFSPFRQISAGKVRGSLGVLFRAWVDRLVSRVIGAVVRLIIIVIGLISLAASVVVVGLRLLIWPLLPILPIIFIALGLWGWLP